MPLNRQHIYSEGAEKNLPLFVLLPETPARIKRGLKGAGLPFVEEYELFEEYGEGGDKEPSRPVLNEAGSSESLFVESSDDQDLYFDELPDDPDIGSFLS
jgi:hypothetical protein